jgi:hypothetical protein
MPILLRCFQWERIGQSFFCGKEREGDNFGGADLNFSKLKPFISLEMVHGYLDAAGHTLFPCANCIVANVPTLLVPVLPMVAMILLQFGSGGAIERGIHGSLVPEQSWVHDEWD